MNGLEYTILIKKMLDILNFSEARIVVTQKVRRVLLFSYILLSEYDKFHLSLKTPVLKLINIVSANTILNSKSSVHYSYQRLCSISHK